MNGSGHYLEAERLLAFAETVDTLQQRQAAQACAQVHATLALAAATALAGRQPGMPTEDYIAWCKLAGGAS